MCVGKCTMPLEIKELHSRYLPLLADVLTAMKELNTASPADFLAKRKKLIDVLTEADSLVARISAYHRDKAIAWDAKRAELAEKARFYQGVSGER